MKTCKACKEVKSLSCFYYRNDSENYRSECKVCWDKKNAARYSANRGAELERRRENYQKNKRIMKIQHSLWAKAHPEEMRAYRKAWKRNNRDKVNADWMKRHAAKLSSTPQWLSQEHLKEIEQIYAFCPDGYHVDHEVPLRGKNVCGLHVAWNLQYLPAAENIRKGNRY